MTIYLNKFKIHLDKEQIESLSTVVLIYERLVALETIG